MDKHLKEQLAQSIFCIKKVKATFPTDVDIHITEFFLMSKLAKRTEKQEFDFSPSDIQKRLHISKPAISQIYNSLEKKGYIQREIDTKDRRKFVVTITPSGQDILERVKDYFDIQMSEMISRFGEENTVQLIELLNRFSQISEEMNRETMEMNEKGED